LGMCLPPKLFPMRVCIGSMNKIPILPLLKDIALEITSVVSLPATGNLFYSFVSWPCFFWFFTHQDVNPLCTVSLALTYISERCEALGPHPSRVGVATLVCYH
jgi:hypothetical protein